VKMLWFALLYGVVTASAGAEMDTINAGIRARIAALRGQPPQELRLPVTKSPVMEDGIADETVAKNANATRKPDPRCMTYTVSAESCSFPNVRCGPPPTIDAQTPLRDLASEFEDDRRASRTGDNQGPRAL
jgi:hypothetical protein